MTKTLSPVVIVTPSVDVVGGLPDGVPPPFIDAVVAQRHDTEGTRPLATESTYCFGTTLKSLYDPNL